MSRVKKSRCGGTWTEARYRQFITTALRQASMRWKPKYDCIKAAFVKTGLNPKTGRKCKLHRCVACRRLFPQKDMRADHIEPVVCPIEGFKGWDVFVDRLFLESQGYQALCVDCHKFKTSQERKIRAANKPKPLVVQRRRRRMSEVKTPRRK